MTIVPNATPTGGQGQPPRPGRYRRPTGCSNAPWHSDPERQGDCGCADEASLEAELRSSDCGWPDAEACRTGMGAWLRRSGGDRQRITCRTHGVVVRAEPWPEGCW